MFRIAREGIPQLAAATVLFGGLAAAAAVWFWPLAPLPLALWAFVLAFFRDPRRVRSYDPGDFCSPADGRITEITALDDYAPIDGPVIRIGMFLSLFNVHVNRFPCSARVVSVRHEPGLFLDARDPESGARNESNTLVLDPGPALPGPVVVRQVAGRVARRIICHARVGQEWPIGGRFGMIKFGSRTELIIPRVGGTEICVSVGDPVRGGLTILARQPVQAPAGEIGHDRQVRRTETATAR